MKRIAVLVALTVVALSVFVAPTARADYETIVNTWFTSESSCQSRGRTLAAENHVYYAPRCTANRWNNRWTLWMMVRESGGGGGWVAPGVPA